MSTSCVSGRCLYAAPAPAPTIARPRIVEKHATLTVVFDLDGTLVDTAPDLVDTLNAVFAREGLPPVPYEEARTHDRRRRAPHDRARAQARRPRGRAGRARPAVRRFHRALFRPYRRPFAAVSGARRRARPPRAGRLPVRGLHQQARRAVAAAARRARPDRALRRDLRPGHVRRARSPTRRSCAGPLRRPAAASTGRSWWATSATDIDTARAAGVPVVAVDFGYTETPVAELGPDRIISHFSELPAAIQALAAART